MGDGSDYPSPRSEGPGGPTSVLITAQDTLSPIPKMPDQLSPNFMEGARPRLSVRRVRDPPKNAVGQIYCDHAECQASPPTFRRPCEWNKHMDKHDRPYKCQEPGCDKIQGFTYSGGLLRHQREVHKKNINAKKPLMCPYPDCNRSTGNGFTRQENLKEHLRRRHMHTENGHAPELAIVPSPDLDGTAVLQNASTTMKRKHDSIDDDPSIIFPEDGENGVDLRSELKRLRREVQEKDRRLEELERVVAGLQQVIPQTAATQG
ncbi:C2H2 transcription factor [Aspergillus rambellii]|uniref:C2H2 transcription factor n=1 Tax=Aspergillus rambellii TaxID=308745 RepID=A0A0F8VCG6_9EURO|nr:C2H2 transcription factor [Aspergillus rambellii]